MLNRSFMFAYQTTRTLVMIIVPRFPWSLKQSDTYHHIEVISGFTVKPGEVPHPVDSRDDLLDWQELQVLILQDGSSQLQLSVHLTGVERSKNTHNRKVIKMRYVGWTYL